MGRLSLLFQRADDADALGVVGVGAVAEVEAEHVGAGAVQPLDHLRRGGGGAERGDDLGPPPAAERDAWGHGRLGLPICSGPAGAPEEAPLRRSRAGRQDPRTRAGPVAGDQPRGEWQPRRRNALSPSERVPSMVARIRISRQRAAPPLPALGRQDGAGGQGQSSTAGTGRRCLECCGMRWFEGHRALRWRREGRRSGRGVFRRAVGRESEVGGRWLGGDARCCRRRWCPSANGGVGARRRVFGLRRRHDLYCRAHVARERCRGRRCFGRVGEGVPGRGVLDGRLMGSASWAVPRAGPR